MSSYPCFTAVQNITNNSGNRLVKGDATGFGIINEMVMFVIK
jgi:hypothetical protein